MGLNGRPVGSEPAGIFMNGKTSKRDKQSSTAANFMAHVMGNLTCSQQNGDWREGNREGLGVILEEAD